VVLESVAKGSNWRILAVSAEAMMMIWETVNLTGSDSHSHGRRNVDQLVV
jgi:hypothetical protein